ncbi:Probable transcription factor At1g66420 [Linum perenne]
MAPKRTREDPPAPASSSSDEEDEYTTESEDEGKQSLPHSQSELLKKKHDSNASDAQVMPTEETAKSSKLMPKVQTPTPAAAAASASKSKAGVKKKGNDTQDTKRQKGEAVKSAIRDQNSDSEGSDSDSEPQVTPKTSAKPAEVSKPLKLKSKAPTPSFAADASASKEVSKPLKLKSKAPTPSVAAVDASASKEVSKPLKLKSKAATPSVDASASVVKKRGNGDMQTQAAKPQEREGGKSEDKSRFQRIWSEDDEIILLEGLIDFFERGLDPFKEIVKFHDFIKKNLSDDFFPSPSQVKNKAVRMKKKFNKNQNGKGLTKPHEQKCFNLSKAIWGTENPSQAIDSKSASKLSGLKKGSNTNNNISKSGGGDELLANFRKEFEGSKNTKKCAVLSLEEIGNIVTKKGLDMVEASKREEFGTRRNELFQEFLKLCELRYRLAADEAESILANKAQNYEEEKLW